jgi:hypothetical protein
LIYPDPLWKDPNLPPPLLLLDFLPPDYVKCKSFDSRKVTFHLLSLIIKEDPSIYETVVLPFI